MKSETFKYIKQDGTETLVEVFYKESDQDSMDASKVFYDGNELVDYLLNASFVLDVK